MSTQTITHPAVSTWQLSRLHARFELIATLRVPIAVIGTIVFPALALLFFVVPQSAVADNPVYATQAVASLVVFAAMTNALFSFGTTIAEGREKPWEPYLRTLPSPGISRVLGTTLVSTALGLIALVPLLVVGGIFTSATASPLRIVAGILALAVVSLPFILLGTVIGYAFSFRAAIAVIQIVMFALAFGGGLFLPPVMFAPWLDTLSRYLPSRQARETVLWAVQGGDLDVWMPLGLLAWTVGLLVLALALFGRNEGRRFR